ncbi:DUF2252 domain-containing protein [Hoyosella rhizosphaerae]|nr:DUF2252 domain-containing protein [Hoyosella rhizosphaerae]MBN4927269.1 DUF2252 domain-containing protein [Hoyosella rhizosphaerae]
MDVHTQKTLFTGNGPAWRSAADARAIGETLREEIPFGAHAEFVLHSDRPTVEDYITDTNEGREENLIPIRIGRMSATPFAFYRGTAGLMAFDLHRDTITGYHAQLCGDAHAGNFGLFAGRLGGIIMDLNDFDETIPGPWEWDLKRLAASLILAGRNNDIKSKTNSKAARHAARAYRRTMHRLADMPFLQAWRTLPDETALKKAKVEALEEDFIKAMRKAQRNTSTRIFDRWTEQEDGQWRFTDDPPVRTHITATTENDIVEALRKYVTTLPASQRPLAHRYRIHDIVHRVVGTGSVGLHSYLALLQGNGNEVLVLQIKQAQPSLLAPYVNHTTPEHNGQRIVEGIKLVQADYDPSVGWTSIGDREYRVRQFRNHKAHIDPTTLTGNNLDDYGRLTGALLARAHARTLDPRILSAYLRKGKHFDKAIAAYANTYADQMERDYRDFQSMVGDKLFPVMHGV